MENVVVTEPHGGRGQWNSIVRGRVAGERRARDRRDKVCGVFTFVITLSYAHD